MKPSSSILAWLCALTAAGCITPETDRPGEGSVPDVTGTIEGTILYVGQRPECSGAGEERTVRGNVALLLFHYDDPPPPSGTATRSESLLVVPGSELFERSDCLPAAPSPEELSQVITRSADFVWPDIALARGEDAEVEYQIRAFYDRDGDFNPFFSVRRLATKGDVAGGAFVNTAVAVPQFERVRFESVEDRPNGQVVRGVAVTLGARVNTELPASRLGDGTRALPSEAVIPPTSDAVVREQLLWDYSRMRLSLIDPTDQSWAQTLGVAGMSIDPHPSGHGWFVLPVDADRDGAQDPHPTLGAAGVMWEHPIVILRRARNPIELAVGIPDAVIIASVRPSRTLSKDTFAPDIDIVVAPIAAVTLDPAIPDCRVPYIAPGNLAETYERIPVDCQELPTGNYDVNVLTGIAGGRALSYREELLADMPGLPPTVLDLIVGARTDNDWVIEGGSYSSQAWSIPNELGCPDPVYRPLLDDEGNPRLDMDGNPIAVSQVDEDPAAHCGPASACDASGTNMQCSQGPAGRFSVVDPDPDNAPSASDTSDGHGVASCRTALRASTMMPDSVSYMDVDAACCGAVRHLCGLPLCPLESAAALGHEDVRAIREIRLRAAGEDYEVGEDGTITPLCVPFLMPASCCRGATD